MTMVESLGRELTVDLLISIVERALSIADCSRVTDCMLAISRMQFAAEMLFFLYTPRLARCVLLQYSIVALIDADETT